MNDTQNAGPAAGAFDGIRVLDMARVLAGPWAAQLLADLGADVVKIEHPRRGDDSRSWEPSFESRSTPGARQSAYFCSANRGKRSVTVDFGKLEGAAIVRELVRETDVLIENYKVGTLARYGLGYDDLAAVNPRLIYCSITGFGQDGPYRQRAGYDTVIQAIGGLMSLTGERDGRPGAGPQRAGLPVIDLMTGLYAALSITAALRHREATGRGQAIDLGLLDVQVAALSYFGMGYLASDVVPQRMGNSNPVTYPSGTFAASDKDIVLLVGNNEQFRRFCGALGAPQLAQDPRFITSPLRVRNAEVLSRLIEPGLRSRDAATWMETLSALGVPCAPINDLKQVFEDPHVVARRMVATVDDPVVGAVPMIRSPIRMSASRVRDDRPAPALGAQTESILEERLGCDATQLDAWRRDGVI